MCWRGERRGGFSPYGRGPAAHGANWQRPDHGEECLAPDTGAVLDHTTRNWKKQREGSGDEKHESALQEMFPGSLPSTCELELFPKSAGFISHTHLEKSTQKMRAIKKKTPHSLKGEWTDQSV